MVKKIKYSLNGRVKSLPLLNILFIKFLILNFILYSCEQEITLDINHNPKLTLNCILNPDSIVEARLTLSQNLNSQHSFEPIDDSKITLYEENRLIGVLRLISDGKYQLNKKPKEGKIYKIIAETKNFNTISAETTIPDIPDVKHNREYTGYSKYDSTLKIFDLHVQINDNPGKDNYWIYRYGEVNRRKFGGAIQEINAPFLDGFNKIPDTEAKYGFRLSHGVRLTDDGFDGKLMNFIIPDFPEPRQFNFTEAVHVMNTDEHYDKYIKTSIINRMKETSDLPFFEPVQIHSNIVDGYGIFGSCAITAIKF